MITDESATPNDAMRGDGGKRSAIIDRIKSGKAADFNATSNAR